MLPLAVRLIIVYLVGSALGSLVNWAIYSLAWNPRPISPWSRGPAGLAPRTWHDRLPIFGWWRLKREVAIHGRRFWWRPLALETCFGLALAWLYWWEVERLGLIRGQLLGLAILPPLSAVHWEFVSHSVLLSLMLAASFIDIDEKIIPDEITIPGTLLGLLLAAVLPMSLLPNVAERMGPPGPSGAPAHRLLLLKGVPVLAPGGQQVWLEPTTAVAPSIWPPTWGMPGQWQSLAIAVACYWLWCFALAPRIWRGRRGAAFALRLIGSRLRREFARGSMAVLLLAGTIAIAGTWWFGGQSWAGLLTALIGLVGSGGMVWAVRIIGTAALRREAMGFGDVTLMMMVGTFLGWQACLIAFFLAPFAGLFVGIAQFVLRRDDVIPYGPFLCLGSATVVVYWAPIWLWAQDLFAIGMLVPAVLVVCLALLGLILAIWRVIKELLFGRSDA